MLNSSSIDKYWKYLEAQNSPPKYIKKVSVIEFDKLKDSINKNEIYIKSLVKKMYCGEAFIIRKAAKQNLKKIILDLAKQYDKKLKPSFHKMLDGCPNFHRIIDKKITKNIVYTQ